MGILEIELDFVSIILWVISTSSLIRYEVYKPQYICSVRYYPDHLPAVYSTVGFLYLFIGSHHKATKDGRSCFVMWSLKYFDYGMRTYSRLSLLA